MSWPSGPPRAVDLAPGAAGVHRLRRALERAEQDFVAEVVADGGIDPWRRRVEGRFRAARDALARSGVSRVESAALIVALVDRAVRDRCWLQVDADPDRRWLVLWRHLARRALPPYRTEPLFLLAWTAWRRRRHDDRAGRSRLRSRPGPAHRASVLLGRMLAAGADPRLLPSLAGDPTARPAAR